MRWLLLTLLLLTLILVPFLLFEQQFERLGAAMPMALSSTAQDLMAGRRTEIDDLNGFVVRRGAALGVPTPVNRTLQALVGLAEAASEER